MSRKEIDAEVYKRAWQEMSKILSLFIISAKNETTKESLEIVKTTMNSTLLCINEEMENESVRESKEDQ